MGAVYPNLIVGIGGSAGALNAYKALLDSLPSQTGMAFVFVSHLLPTAHSQLAQILSRHTTMPVLVASTAMPIRANHVYMSPPNADLLIERHTFKVVSPRTRKNGQIDLLFISLAEALGARAIGIILPGYSGDGIEGCKHIRAKGGTTFAQDLSADVNGMPLSAQASDCVDFVLSPQEITLELARISRRFRPLPVSTKAGKEPKSTLPFDPLIFLAKIGAGHTIANYRKNQKVFSQGDPADHVFFMQHGKVKLTVVSSKGQEAVVGMLGADDFFGEGCLVGQPTHMATATAMTNCRIVRLEKAQVVQVLHDEPVFSKLFLFHVLTRNIRLEEDLVDQLFHSSEMRLARVLLLLANFDTDGKQERVIAKISQERLAEIIGTTRSRVSHFMNKFRKLGLIEYNGGLTVHSSLKDIIRQD
ncbi:MAG: cyclic nucleotide-binding domain-containing protein [Nitrospiraceae bacterium]|nr:cyclic nucleotide-binding domain-containing protein [Nitrospiraceae bacterium]